MTAHEPTITIDGVEMAGSPYSSNIAPRNVDAAGSTFEVSYSEAGSATTVTEFCCVLAVTRRFADGPALASGCCCCWFQRLRRRSPKIPQPAGAYQTGDDQARS